jgi:queuine/archaeosine tRNA-ribosyltransferase
MQAMRDAIGEGRLKEFAEDFFANYKSSPPRSDEEEDR